MPVRPSTTRIKSTGYPPPNCAKHASKNARLPPCGLRESGLRIQRHAQPSREVLHELPGDAAGAGATGGCPFERVAFELFAPIRDAEMGDVALDHGEKFVLAAAVKSEPEAESIRERHFF